MRLCSNKHSVSNYRGLPGGAVVKNPPANAGDVRYAGSIPGWERFPGIGNGNLIQYSYQGNPIGTGTLQVTVHGVIKSWTWLSPHFSPQWCLYVTWISLINTCIFLNKFLFLNFLYFKNVFLKIQVIGFIFIFLARVLVVSLWEPAKYNAFLKVSKIKSYIKKHKFFLSFTIVVSFLLCKKSAYPPACRKNIFWIIFQTLPYGFLSIIGCVLLTVGHILAM